MTGDDDGGEENISFVHAATDGIESVQFSACGKNIIIKQAGSSLPTLCSLVEDPLYRRASEREKSRLALNRAEHSEVTARDCEHSTSTLTSRSASLDVARPVVTGQSTSTIRLSNWTTQRDVQLVTATGDTLITQHLVSLPDSWEDIGGQTGVAISEKENGTVGVVLNQAPKIWYSGPDALGRNLPIYIEKDRRALLPPRKRNAAELLWGVDDAGEDHAVGRDATSEHLRRRRLE